MQKIVKVIFDNKEYNYSTNVNPKATDEEIQKYFVNNYFDVGIFPHENLQKVIKIEINNQ
jgi:hypothetical protein